MREQREKVDVVMVGTDCCGPRSFGRGRIEEYIYAWKKKERKVIHRPERGDPNDAELQTVLYNAHPGIGEHLNRINFACLYKLFSFFLRPSVCSRATMLQDLPAVDHVLLITMAIKVFFFCKDGRNVATAAVVVVVAGTG